MTSRLPLDPTSQLRPAWTVYFATDDADEIARKVVASGGKVVVQPMDVMDAGRMAYFADPTGAHFAVWQARTHQGAQVVDAPARCAAQAGHARPPRRARSTRTVRPRCAAARDTGRRA
jgi:hypothetical protein